MLLVMLGVAAATWLVHAGHVHVVYPFALSSAS